MCRLLGILSNRAIDPRILTEFRKLAERGKTPKDYGCPQISTRQGHPDGWGMTCLAEDGEVYRRSHLNALEDPFYEEAVKELGNLVSPPFMLMAHLRRAARQETIKQEFNQPYRREFRGGALFFAHNGNIEDFRVRDGKIDSQFFFERLIDAMEERSSSLPEVKKVVGGVKDGITKEFAKRVTSLTFLVSDGRELVAHRDARQCKPYYSFHECRTEGAYVVCSEVLTSIEGKWRLLRNNETVVVASANL